MLSITFTESADYPYRHQAKNRILRFYKIILFILIYTIFIIMLNCVFFFFLLDKKYYTCLCEIINLKSKSFNIRN